MKVAQYHQTIDSRAIVHYLSKNLRNVCLTSSYVVMVTISTMKTLIQPETSPIQMNPSDKTTEKSPDISNLPRASLPKMTLDPEPETPILSPPKPTPVGYYTYELTHELPMKCAGMSVCTLQSEPVFYYCC